ncbi:kinase-like domain-containing protein [Rhexocercosporidium sp. MPI-PUGE-AT-0058]|nr:kinase-like domain-containing protein [Rhexocercosporidium sp. MPI-PUGE-AT-0058]
MPQKYDIPTKVAGVSQRQSEREGPVMQTAIDFEYRGNPKKEHENSSHSFASYYSAQSSLVGNASLASRYSSGFRYPAFGISRRNTSSFQQSPTYYSAESSLALDTEKGVKEDPVKTTSGYLKAIQERGLILPLDQELNWSGKENGGQHVEFNKGDALPFEVIGPIGTSLTAQVDKIRCRRILLARKTMICGRRMTLEEALVEVEHLQKLRHPHIVQLVGSYLQGKKFSVLLYPVADYELTVFLDEVLDIVQETPDMKERAAKGNRTVRAGALFVGPAPQAIAAMWSFFGCLVDAVRYIHSTARKHLDIKPGNILVRKHPQATYGYRIYIADFGISRSFKYLDHSQTDTHIRRTPKYCAPEVWEQDVHGRAADIFSLGCVFMEMLTILCWRDLDDFADFRSGDGEGRGAYHESIDRIFEWAEQLRLELEGYFMYESLFQTYGSSVSLVPKIQGVDATLQMLARESEKRKLPIFNRGEPASDGCHTCGEVPETYEYEAEV